ncbi:MAG: hypothetical protein ABW199_11990 [Caulobacterales bacterium]
MIASYSSASRLLSELEKLRKLFRGSEQQTHVVLMAAYSMGAGYGQWARSIGAFSALVSAVIRDMEYVSDEKRRKTLAEVIEPVAELVHPAHFATVAHKHFERCASQRAFDYLDMLDEVLRREGATVNVEVEKASYVSEELRRIVDDIAQGPTSEIDDFLLEELTKLRVVLDNFALFGSDGVQDVIARMIGTIAVKSPNLNLSERTKLNIKSTLSVAKVVADIFIYGASIGQGITWAQENIVGLLPEQ